MTTRLLSALILGFLILGLLNLAACGRQDDAARSPATAAAQSADAHAEQEMVHGRLEDGLRVLTFDPAQPTARFTIFRGDYVRPEMLGGAPFTLEIPSLDVTMSVPVPAGERTYFKVPDAGVYPYKIGEMHGEIEAIDFRDTRYKEISAQEAAALIANIHPVVLDVRTSREYAGGHLEGAVLIPVQELARRSGELADHQRDPVLVYCATGNRSTVAAKMLVDAGFEQVINMRRGIAEWAKEGLPEVK